ncbi:hypothetical protein QJS66_05885 [Kocuria rhizophila]|nr:hypothetical protein QJS66_05885 [Kocuria rhizophila]
MNWPARKGTSPGSPWRREARNLMLVAGEHPDTGWPRDGTRGGEDGKGNGQASVRCTSTRRGTRTWTRPSGDRLQRGRGVHHLRSCSTAASRAWPAAGPSSSGGGATRRWPARRRPAPHRLHRRRTGVVSLDVDGATNPPQRQRAGRRRGGRGGRTVRWVRHPPPTCCRAWTTRGTMLWCALDAAPAPVAHGGAARCTVRRVARLTKNT